MLSCDGSAVTVFSVDSPPFEGMWRWKQIFTHNLARDTAAPSVPIRSCNIPLGGLGGITVEAKRGGGVRGVRGGGDPAKFCLSVGAFPLSLVLTASLLSGSGPRRMREDEGG